MWLCCACQPSWLMSQETCCWKLAMIRQWSGVLPPYAESFRTQHMFSISIQWRHNEHDGATNHQPHECLLKVRIKENIKAPRHWPLWGNSSVSGEFPAQRASNAENVSIWWRHHYIQFYKDIAMQTCTCWPLEFIDNIFADAVALIDVRLNVRFTGGTMSMISQANSLVVNQLHL